MEEIKEKRCSKCKDEKSIDEFYTDKRNTDGLRSQCKQCCLDGDKEYRFNNKEKISDREKGYREKDPEYRKEYRRKYYLANLEKVRKQNREWKKKNPEYQKKWSKKNLKHLKKYKEKNSEKIKSSAQRSWLKRKDNPIFKLNNNTSVAIRKALKGNKKGRHWEDMVGYTLDELKTHLESQFKEGMNWNNYGKNGWHIDHIIPKSLFNITSAKCKGFKKCWALENLRPMWGSENLKKYNKLFY